MKLILAFIFLIPFLSFGQHKLKKKYCGNYSGSIPAYKMEDGKTIVEVDSVSIQIEFLIDGTVNYTIGNTKDHGTYNVEFTADSFMLISAKLENQKAEEKIKLYLKDKHLEREGIYPQPEGRLVKFKE
ncbi:MAG: hypothetical protein LW701_03410 [Fluviicola sp.]|jgi:hypothetical protein|nr:hypothetical protein [Fluviicola sp.]